MRSLAKLFLLISSIFVMIQSASKLTGAGFDAQNVYADIYPSVSSFSNNSKSAFQIQGSYAFEQVESVIRVNSAGDATNSFTVTQTNNHNTAYLTGMRWLWACPNGCPFLGIVNNNSGETLPFSQSYSNGTLTIDINFPNPIPPGGTIKYTQTATATEKAQEVVDGEWRLEWSIFTGSNTRIIQEYFLPQGSVVDLGRTSPNPNAVVDNYLLYQLENSSRLDVDMYYFDSPCMSLDCINGFLDLPVSYHYDTLDAGWRSNWNPNTGGDPAEALLGRCLQLDSSNNAQCPGRGPGLVTAYFDHKYPTYCAPPNAEGWIEGTTCRNPNGVVTVWDGRDLSLSGLCVFGFNCYEGHNGTDFQNMPVASIELDLNNDGTSEDVIYASHSGTIWAVCEDRFNIQNGTGNPKCTKSSSYGTYVILQDENYPCLSSMYAHLDALAPTVFEGAFLEHSIGNTRQPIGEMGNTGGGPVHLHFGVYWDCSENPTWPEESAIDPFGWRGEMEDPATLTNTSASDAYLWRHNIGYEVIVGTGSTQIQANSVSLHLPAGTLPEGSIVSLTRVPTEASIEHSYANIGLAFKVEVQGDSQSITNFLVRSAIISESAVIGIRYEDYMLDLIDEEESLSVYLWNEALGNWEKLPTVVDSKNNILAANTSQFGYFAVLGQPKHQILLPFVSK